MSKNRVKTETINQDTENKEKKSSEPFKSMSGELAERVRPYYRTFILCLVLLVISSAVRISGPVVIQQAVDNYIIPKNFEGLLILLSGYVIILIIGFVANYYEIVKLETVGQKIIAGIKKAAFQHLLTLNMSYFDKSTTGKLVSRIENDSNAMKVLFTSVITNVAGNLLLFAGMFGVMAFKYNSLLAFCMLFFLPFMGIGAYAFNKYVAPKLVEVRKYVADVSGYINESIYGMSVIQIFGNQDRAIRELEERSVRKYKLERVITLLFNSFFNIFFFTETIGVCLILWIGGNMVIKGEMQIGSLILFITFLRHFFMSIIQLSAQFNEFQKGVAGAVRIFELLRTKNYIPEPEKPEAIPEIKKGADIEFRNVWFRYDENSDWILEDISFYCPAGEHWAIVGPTGSGKTTIINLLLKFYLPQKGEIIINGVNIADVPAEELRNQLGLVLQDNILFPGTIYENLTLSQTHFSREKVQKLMTELGIDPVIERLPDGYDTELLENAQNLSAGEKQLISFGRALLKNPSILIFDEATSNIDPEIERKIKEAMNNLIEGRTALIIAHRFSTIRNADRIVVLKYGKLIESGNHKELMTYGGFYSQLQLLQAG